MNTWFEWREAPPGDYAVLGDPISHSLSPKMHQVAYQVLGLNYTYNAIRCVSGELEECLNHLADQGYKGVNCTVPLKEKAFELSRNRDEYANKLRVVNTIDLVTGKSYNTDSLGFSATLRDIQTENRWVLVLGAGGSSRAVIDALIRDGWEVTLWNRTYERAKSLVLELGFQCEVIEELVIDQHSLIVNTTSSSLTGGSLPIENEWYNSADNALFYDIAYSKSMTPLVERAKLNGLRVKDGRQMLMEQGALAFEYWLETSAPRLEMLEALA